MNDHNDSELTNKQRQLQALQAEETKLRGKLVEVGQDHTRASERANTIAEQELKALRQKHESHRREIDQRREREEANIKRDLETNERDQNRTRDEIQRREEQLRREAEKQAKEQSDKQ